MFARSRSCGGIAAWVGAFGAGLGGLIVVAVLVYRIPAVNDRLAWRIDMLRGRIRDILSPHAETLPTPVAAITAMPTFDLATATPAPAVTSLPQVPTVTATLPPDLIVDLPAVVTLTGARYEPQLYNNCGPATLTAGLTFWGWQGSEPDGPVWRASGKDVRWQRDIASVLKPDQADKNVMPYELANYSVGAVGLNVVIRYGGDIDLVRRWVANGFPVILERGFRDSEHRLGQGWEGHYSLVTGYDDNAREFITQDSFLGPNYRRGYDAMMADWRDFNYVYLVLYPADRAAHAAALLGPDVDPAANTQRALARAQAETQTLTDPTAQAFAWFNVGTSLQLLGRSAEAAAAFDVARSYNLLPWRMLWYQTDMYKAYYQTGRYQDVIELATVTLATPNLEESYYWRAHAYDGLGDREQAVADMQQALEAHPGWDQALAVLSQWGVQ